MHIFDVFFCPMFSVHRPWLATKKLWWFRVPNSRPLTQIYAWIGHRMGREGSRHPRRKRKKTKRAIWNHNLNDFQWGAHLPQYSSRQNGHFIPMLKRELMIPVTGFKVRAIAVTNWARFFGKLIWGEMGDLPGWCGRCRYNLEKRITFQLQERDREERGTIAALLLRTHSHYTMS